MSSMARFATEVMPAVDKALAGTAPGKSRQTG